MRKLPASIVFAVVAILGVGSFGLTLHAQQRAEEQLTGAFAVLHDVLGKGGFGKVELDLAKRTLKLSDIELKTGGTPPLTLKVRELTASGIEIPADWRLAAERIEALDVEVSAAFGPGPIVSAVYKAPRILVTDYRGPIAPLRSVDTSNPLDVARLVLEQIVATAATSVSIPTLNATVSPAGAGPQPLGEVNYTYSDISFRDVRAGRIGDMTIGDTKLSIVTPPEALGQITGQGGRSTVSDFDFGVLLSLLDPTKPKDDNLVRLQGRGTVGPYSLQFGTGGRLDIGGIEVGNISVRPAKLKFAQFAELLQAIAPQLGSANLGDEAAELTAIAADMYEGVNLDMFEIRGVALNLPNMPPFKLGAFRFKGYERGKLGELAIEGVEGITPDKQPVKLGRLALKGIDFANAVRVGAEFRDGQMTPEKLAKLIALVEGGEIKDLVAPYKNTGQTVTIDNFAISWGQYVGPIPTSMHVTLRMNGPLDIGDPNMIKELAAAGITTAAVDFDLGAGWTEATRIFALAPADLGIGRLLSLNARVSVGNVPRELFSIDPFEALQAAGQVEAGLAEFVLRDAGVLDFAVAQFAKQQGQPVRVARAALIESINQAAAPLIAASPELQPVVDAIGHFIETPKSAITLRIIPKGHVPLQSLIESAATDPTSVLSQFRIEATTAP